MAPVTNGGSSLTGPKVGSGKLSKGFAISGIDSSVNGTSNNCDLISNKVSAAVSKGLGNPNLRALSPKAFITLSDIFRGVPSTGGTFTQQYTPPPSMISQVAGLGLGLAGLGQAFPNMFSFGR